MEIKTNIEGTLLKGPQGEIWMAPHRDLVHAFPIYIRKALTLATLPSTPLASDLMAAEGGEAALSDYAAALGVFTRMCFEDRNSDSSLHQAVEKSGLESVDQRVQGVLGYCLLCVILGAFWKATEESNSVAHENYLQSLEVPIPKAKGFRGWLKRAILKVYNWI